MDIFFIFNEYIICGLLKYWLVLKLGKWYVYVRVYINIGNISEIK